MKGLQYGLQRESKLPGEHSFGFGSSFESQNH